MNMTTPIVETETKINRKLTLVFGEEGDWLFGPDEWEIRDEENGNIIAVGYAETIDAYNDANLLASAALMLQALKAVEMDVPVSDQAGELLHAAMASVGGGME